MKTTTGVAATMNDTHMREFGHNHSQDGCEWCDNQQSDRTEAARQDFTNFEVFYVAPTEPGHTFEPRCYIMADSALHGSDNYQRLLYDTEKL